MKKEHNMQSEGIRLAALYSTGCPELLQAGSNSSLVSFLRGNGTAQSVRHLLEAIDPFFYYMLIAMQSPVQAGVSNFFDPRVVSAHWLGNEFLFPVKGEEIQRVFRNGKVGELNPHKAREMAFKLIALKGRLPHHNLCVLSILAGARESKLVHELDSCLVSAAEVVSLEGDKIRARKLSLVQTFPGAPVEAQEVVCVADKGFVDCVKPGDLVSLHLGAARQIISREIFDRLNEFTLRGVKEFQRERK